MTHKITDLEGRLNASFKRADKKRSKPKSAIVPRPWAIYPFDDGSAIVGALPLVALRVERYATVAANTRHAVNCVNLHDEMIAFIRSWLHDAELHSTYVAQAEAILAKEDAATLKGAA